MIPKTQLSSDGATSPHFSAWTCGPKRSDVRAWHPRRMLMAPKKKDEQRQEMCMRMGPLFSVQRNEQLGSWEEMLLYHYSLCVTLRSIWTAVRGIIIVFFWPCDETRMRFLICFYWVFLLALRLVLLFTALLCATCTHEILTFSWIWDENSTSNFKTL